MRFELDENIPVGLANVLSGLGHDVDTVPQESLTGQPDSHVLDCRARGAAASDHTGSGLRGYASFAPGTHCGIILVRLSNPSRRELVDRIGSLFLNEPIEEWSGCFVVLTDRKIRIRRSH
jgi:Domain of unknown function (DUF5615)